MTFPNSGSNEKHPPEELLINYAEGRLSEMQKHDIEIHLTSCAECLELVNSRLQTQLAFARLHRASHATSPQELLPTSNNLEIHWQPQLTKRLRVLLHTTPLLQLRDWDALRNPETRHYDSIALAMRVLDHIVDSMGLGVDADNETVVRTLQPLLYQMDLAAQIEPPPKRHIEFANSLLGRLRNDADARRPFKLEYPDFANNQMIQRQLELHLVEERFASDERIVLQLSSEAINLFLGALDLEIEDAQAATEAVIQSQLERGRFNEAAQAARDARLRSVQFEEKIKRKLHETKRDISRVDWRESVPRLLKEALQHIKTRLKVEEHIANTARERLELLELGSHEAEQVAHIAGIVDDCFERHVRLHGVLIDARGIFFSEQERQAFVPRPTVHLPNLFTDVLEPLLESPKEVARDVLEETVSLLLGTHTPGVFSLSGLITGLLRPRRENLQLTLPSEEETWFSEQADKVHYPSELRQAAQPYLANLPTRLSKVLEKATQTDVSQELLEYLALTTLHAFEHTSEATLQAQNIGEKFEQSGFYGDDLELDNKSFSKDMSDEALLEKV
jgi:hypothetical protein